MTRRVLIGILVVLLLVAGAVGVGAMAYRAGVVQGAIASGQVVVPQGDGGRGPEMYFFHGGPFFGRGHMGWGMGGGFGFLSCLVPLFGLFLFFGLMRLLFGHQRWSWGGGYGRWGGGPGGPGMGWGGEQHPVPPAFEAWHRRAHGEAAPATPPTEPPAQPGQ